MGFHTEALPWTVNIGAWNGFSTINLRSRIEQSINDQFDWVIFPLFNDQQIQQNSLDLDFSSIPCEEDIANTTHLRRISIQINKSINILNIKNLEAFKFIIGYASYLGLHSIVLNIPNSNNLKEVLVELNKIIDTGIFYKMHIVWCVELSQQKADSAWEDYIYLRNNLSKKVYFDLMLEIVGNFPQQQKILRWLPERVDYITLPTNIFTTNNKGFPVLIHKHQQLVRKLFYHKTRIVIKDLEKSELNHYVKLIEFMVKQLQKKPPTGHLALSQFDILQEPLQPYSDNLESQTYSVFQLDNAKYDEYQIALIDAMNSFPQNTKIIIFYVGCGRGALMFNCFNASKKTGRKIHIYAIDKNPYPIQALKRRIAVNKWTKNVDLVCEDAKTWIPKEQADICLSELLGAFGDNELSPQCLSWTEKHIGRPGSDKFKKQTICIPQKYTAYISPLSYNIVQRNLNIKDRQNYFTVKVHNCYKPSNIQAVWTFDHPLPQNETFERKSTNIFKFSQSCLIHGFVGYFTSELYGRGRLSILPQDHTQQMQSWYPLFFSFKKQILISADNQLQIQIVRKSELNKVWYEWQYKIFKNKQIIEESQTHNAKGIRQAINC